MVNAWSLAASILDGTFDEDYPIMKIEPEPAHSDYYYDYTRNDPDAENPFTEAFDYLMGESVTGKTPWIYESPDGGKTVYRYERGTDPLKRELVDIEMADVDDQRAHHFNDYTTEKTMAKTNHEFKYHEDEILKDIQEYVSRTYQGHYTGTKHEFRKVQTIDLMAARDIATGFCQANILKYGSRYGSKDGRNKTDLLKVIHYAMLLLHFDGHYGEPSMPSGNFDQMP
jgi:hypothetical protein|tara:strand:- start:880 stop:1560 length:681 start_codon:yes stop_codon:yes gene_type:complete